MWPYADSFSSCPHTTPCAESVKCKLTHYRPIPAVTLGPRAREELTKFVHGQGFGGVVGAPVDGMGAQQGIVDGFFGGIDGGFEERGDLIFVNEVDGGARC